MWLISFKTAKWLGNWNRNSNKTQQKININFFVCWKQKHTTSNIACIHTPSESNRNRKWNFILLVNFKIRRCSAFVRRRSTVVGSNGWTDGRTDDSGTNVRTDIDCFSHLGFFLHSWAVKDEGSEKLVSENIFKSKLHIRIVSSSWVYYKY